MYILKKCFVILLITAISNTISAQQNTLTSQEKQDGWQLLFNGKDLQGWHSYLEDKPGKAWQVQDGAIFLNKNDLSVFEDYADLTSDSEFANFDLKLEFKTDTCANSGVMFYVHESPEYKYPWETGPEMQIDDVVCGPDHLSKMNRMGTLYDLYPIDSQYIGPSGKWYQFEIKADNGHVELFEDGHKVVDAYLWNQHWKDLIAAVKFKDMPNFGTFRKGHIALQGTENGKIWFRNIKIKELK
ncbi:MAG: 3-keto-disaccharide hydrolase [Ilyomonas sp.]